MIYVNSIDRTAELEIPFTTAPSGTIDIIITGPGMEEPYEVPNVVFTPGKLSITVPLHLCQTERDLDIHWSFDYVENSETYTFHAHTVVNVVYPILTASQIKAIHPNATTDEVTRIEQAVRHIINAHCGQTFGRYVGTHEVKGSDNNILQLPQRIIELIKVNGVDAGNYFTIQDNGWAIKHFPWGVPPVKADYYGLHQHVGGVIHNPNNVRLGQFWKSATYTIEGVWGWQEIPAAVQEAAKLLVNDYACGDAQYRDRYLTSMTAADWRIQFNSGAFAETGNVRADQLLADYVLKYRWLVV